MRAPQSIALSQQEEMEGGGGRSSRKRRPGSRCAHRGHAGGETDSHMSGTRTCADGRLGTKPPSWGLFIYLSMHQLFPGCCSRCRGQSSEQERGVPVLVGRAHRSRDLMGDGEKGGEVTLGKKSGETPPRR